MNGRIVRAKMTCQNCNGQLTDRSDLCADCRENLYLEREQNFHNYTPPEPRVKIGFFTIIFLHALLFTALSLLLGPTATQYGWPFVIIDTAGCSCHGTRAVFLVDGFIGDMIIYYLAAAVVIGVLWVIIRTAVSYRPHI